jgi:hypothetical protein
MTYYLFDKFKYILELLHKIQHRILKTGIFLLYMKNYIILQLSIFNNTKTVVNIVKVLLKV